MANERDLVDEAEKIAEQVGKWIACNAELCKADAGMVCTGMVLLSARLALMRNGDGVAQRASWIDLCQKMYQLAHMMNELYNAKG